MISDLEQRMTDDPRLAATTIVRELTASNDAQAAIAELSQLATRTQDPLLLARVYRVAAKIFEQRPALIEKWSGAQRPGDNDFNAAAFASVAKAVELPITLPTDPVPATLGQGQLVWATSPVRIDFAGGWSDTPPICIEQGGAVCNGAITLMGRQPVQAVARLMDEPAIRITSIDLGCSETITQATQIMTYTDPTQWSALPKAALVLAGLAPADDSHTLKSWLKAVGGGVGGGIDLTVFSGLPKGSGLGTSSILSATLLACLDRLLGRDESFDDLIARTSMLEQMMHTGGGWQDQAGGITPGLKLLTTNPGRDQVPAIESVSLDPNFERALASRTILYYTGIQRLARGILHNVVGRYLDRDPEALAIFEGLRAGAMRTKEALDVGDVEAFATGVDEYRGFKTSIDPGAVNDEIHAIIEPFADDLICWELPGAGGGGFIYMIAKDAAAAERIQKHLAAHPANRQARLYDMEFDHNGLQVTVM